MPLNVQNFVVRYGWTGSATSVTNTLAAIDTDLLIMEGNYLSNVGADNPFTPAQIDTIQAGAGGKLVFAYMSIGVIQEARDRYSQFSSQVVLTANGDNYIAYWDPAGVQAVNPVVLQGFKNWVADLIAQGFDGAFLDVVGTYARSDIRALIPGATNEQDYIIATTALMTLVVELDAYARTLNPDFQFIFGSNPDLVLHHFFPGVQANPSPNTALVAAFQAAIDGILVESLHFGAPNSEVNRIANNLTPGGQFSFGNAQRFVIDYFAADGVFDQGEALAAAAREFQINAGLRGWTPYAVPVAADDGRAFTQTYPIFNTPSSGPDALLAPPSGGALSGGGGEDYLHGQGGADTLDGGAQNDVLRGAAGNDVLIGGAGADALDGGAGIDTARYTIASTGATWIRSPSGAWTVNAGADGVDTLTGVEFLDFTNRDVFLAPAPTNFNADGVSDLMWRNNATGAISLWLISGTQQITNGGGFGGAAGWTPRTVADFNNDGIGDIVWQTSGAVSLWLLDANRQPINGGTFYMPAEWNVSKAGDFNGDGITDLLLRNANTGAVSIWRFNQNQQISNGGGWNVGTEWTVAQTGDFNSDGITDLLWRSTSGATQLWLFNSAGNPTNAGGWYVPTSWTAQETGDFNRDGISDILWRNSTGELSLWLMGTNQQPTNGGSWYIPPSWNIADVGDYNGDGVSDIMWRGSTGELSLWLFDQNQNITNGGGWYVPPEWGTI